MTSARTFRQSNDERVQDVVSSRIDRVVWAEVVDVQDADRFGRAGTADVVRGGQDSRVLWFGNKPRPGDVVLVALPPPGGSRRIIAIDRAFTEVSAGGDLNLQAWNLDPVDPAALGFYKSHSQVEGDHGAVVNGEILGLLSFAGSDGSQWVGAGNIRVEVSGAVAAGSVPGRMSFATRAVGAASSVQHLFLHPDGMVSIGAGTAPNARLDVQNLDPIRWGLFIRPAVGQTAPMLGMFDGTGTGPLPLVVDAAGKVLVGRYGSPVAAGGRLQVDSGITFPAVEALAAEANTLDAYEEGLFTPGISFDTPGGTITASGGSVGGRYTRIGQLCFYQLIHTQATFTHTGSGNLRITGLPFAGVGNFAGACTMRYAAAGVGPVAVEPAGAQTYARIIASGNAISPFYLTATHVPSGTPINIRASGFYEV